MRKPVWLRSSQENVMNEEAISKAKQVAEDVVSRHAATCDRDGAFPVASVEALGVAGLLGLCVPKANGGMGAGFEEFAAVVEAIGSACGSTGMIYVMHVAAAKSIEASELKAKEELLANIAAGTHLTSLGASEKGTRSLFWMPMSKLQPSGDGFAVTAHKSWVTSSHHIQSFVATSQSPSAESPFQSDCYLVDMRRDGVNAEASFDGLGLRGNDSAPVVLDNYRVSADEMLTTGSNGFGHLLGVVLPWFLVGTSALSIGLMKATSNHVQRHLLDSKFAHDGSTLADLPNQRARLAQINTQTSAASGLLNIALGALKAADPAATLHLMQARLFVVEAAVAVANLGMMATGGAGFSRHSSMERIFRDAQAGRVMAPTTDHLGDLIGRALLGMELFG